MAKPHAAIMASDIRELSDGTIVITSEAVVVIRLSDGKEYPMFVETLQALERLGYVERQDNNRA